MDKGPSLETALPEKIPNNPFWDAFLGDASKEMSSSQFRTWIKPLAPVGLTEDSLHYVIAAPNQFKLDWVKNQFTNKINDLAKSHLPNGTQIRFIVDSQACSINEAENSSSPSFISTATEQEDILATQDEVADDIDGVTFQINVEDYSKLNPILTFDTFVNGKANQLARAAAIQVANNPGTSYNPMFLYGGVGLGKTHLIHAVGNYLLQQQPDAKIRYIHAEQYVSDVVRAYQQKAFDKFKSYYHSLDLLLIDDIQFFSGKVGHKKSFSMHLRH